MLREGDLEGTRERARERARENLRSVARQRERGIKREREREGGSISMSTSSKEKFVTLSLRKKNFLKHVSVSRNEDEDFFI